MKVTVYFGNVRVIVPCGKGDILVRELMDLAITRYKKATGKPPSATVAIHNLRSSRDDGILYPDDQLNDVADDREQIIADFEENCSPILHVYPCGDGTSTSSACTGSPDIFSVEVSSHGSVPYAHSDVEITEDPLPLGVTPLQVRRGSEPALNALFSMSPTSDPNKRWSTAVVINSSTPKSQENVSEDSKKSPGENLTVNGDFKQPSLNFSRSSGRLSILGNNSETYRWIEAADRQLVKDFNENFSSKTFVCSNEKDAESDASSFEDERERSVTLKNESGPLGIHVVPDYDSKGRDVGLVIQSIEAGGRIDRDGRFHVGDRITEINGRSLRNISFQAAQEIFKNALKTPQIKLQLLHGDTLTHSKTAAIPKKPPPPVYPKPACTESPKKSEDTTALVEGEERAGGLIAKVATVTPTKKIPQAATHRLATANTRKIGKKLSIQLTKGSSGLGFSITTRDNPAGGNSPIYIKNVLPQGAAIEDGRLQPGDRLLEVNGIEMTGKSQAEAVSILRNTPLGGSVNLVVSRQEPDDNASGEQEAEHVSIKIEDETGIFPWKHREILTFQIPLSDTSSSGLGVSVKGKSTTNASSSVDLGIFIKAIIPGGAASKDGRLQTNDQLVNINGISLLGMSNSNAMETLRKAMTQMDGPIPNAIILTIARRILHPPDDNQEISSSHQKTNSMNSQVSSCTSSSLDKICEQNEIKNFHQKSQSNLERIFTNNSPIKDQAKEVNSNGKHFESDFPGSNPVIERLTGHKSNSRSKTPTETYFFSNANTAANSCMQPYLIPFDDGRRQNTYSPTLNSNLQETCMLEDDYNAHTTKKLVENSRSSEISSSNVAPASSQLSLDEINAGFSRDGFGRQSMSEKRHAQLDAKNTDTYQRNKKAREERDRHRQLFEQEYIQGQLESSQENGTSHINSTAPVNSSTPPVHVAEEEPLGPSLGLRKSSSLESLQTMIHELNKDDEAMKKSLHSTSSRNSRSRGCNESFRAAVDRSYEAPPPATMETLDEESESGSSVGHILTRSAEIPSNLHQAGVSTDTFHDDMLSMYRNSKSSKKKSLLKGLGSVFKFGKSRKSMQDLKGKYEDSSPEPENVSPCLSQQIISREAENGSEYSLKLGDGHRKQLPQVSRDTVSPPPPPPFELAPNRQERMQNLREQHQRLHQKRHGHYPLEQKEEFYEKEIKEKEGKMVSVASVTHSRSQSLDNTDDVQQYGGKTGYPESSRFSHYMNYKEIQQHMSQYRHHNQVSSQSHKPDTIITTVLPTKPVQRDRPSSNYFEYESMKHLHRHVAAMAPEPDTSSLPRPSHNLDHSLHMQLQSNKQFYGHDSNNYDRIGTQHYYPSGALYSQIVPGSKV